MNGITINGCKFLKKGIKDAAGNYYPVRYNHGPLVSTKANAVSVYAKASDKGLPAALFPKNDSDSREDYFEKDRVRFHVGTNEYAALLSFCQ